MTRSERRQIRHILRRALAAPLLACATRPKAGAESSSAISAGMAADLIARLVSDGLLAPSPGGFVATPQTAAWLRRDLCDLPDEAHASQHRTVVVETLDMPEATLAFQSRAPSRCMRRSCFLARARMLFITSSGKMAPPARLWVFSRMMSRDCA